jgi:hypothetical protein
LISLRSARHVKVVVATVVVAAVVAEAKDSVVVDQTAVEAEDASQVAVEDDKSQLHH